MDDLQLKQAVIDELEADLEIQPEHIRVQVHQGVVTLAGRVANSAQKSRAESRVLGIDGVVAVAQELEIEAEGAGRRSDEDIASTARHLLDCDPRLPVGAFSVVVEKGAVRLCGEARSEAQRGAAESDVGHVDGVVSVNNEIQLDGSDTTQVQNVIRTAFERAADLEADRISVHFESDGTVTLGGQVHSVLERASAENAAWSVPGVIRVVNRIEIGY